MHIRSVDRQVKRVFTKNATFGATILFVLVRNGQRRERGFWQGQLLGGKTEVEKRALYKWSRRLRSLLYATWGGLPEIESSTGSE